MIKKMTLLALILSCFTTLQAQFITTWETYTVNKSITIPTTGTGYNYTVDWGDGTTSINQTTNATHAYTAAGTYTVSITGDFPRIYFNRAGDRQKIKSIEQWGTQVWTSMESAFDGCASLQGNATDAPNLSIVTDMGFMFSGASSFNQAIGSWNVSKVTNMRYMFAGASSFNQDISGWNVLNVTNMQGMFYSASSFNQAIGHWNVSNVLDMSSMFAFASRFNQDISAWNVSNVLDMGFMFGDASRFNQDINAWNVLNVTDMEGMFYNASSFNQAIGSWNVSKVTNMRNMFGNASSFNQDISAWDVSNVSDMRYMLGGVTLSTENYDFLLEGWSKLTLKRGVLFHGGFSVYCNAEVARQKMIDDFGWTITDGGKDCSLSTPDITAETFKVYPTPTSGNIQIDLDAAIQQITIYNLLGVEVMSQKQVNKKRVDLSALSAGTYILKIQTDTHTIVRKVVKK